MPSTANGPAGRTGRGGRHNGDPLFFLKKYSLIDSFQADRQLIGFMSDRIEDANKIGTYDSAYRVIDLAVNGMRNIG